MKVSVVRGGGVAGMVTTTTLDAADLDGSAAATLAAAVDRARGADVPGQAAPVPDGFDYEVSVEDGSGTAVLGAGQGLAPEVRELVALVQASPARSRRTAPPGA